MNYICRLLALVMIISKLFHKGTATLTKHELFSIEHDANQRICNVVYNAPSSFLITSVRFNSTKELDPEEPILYGFVKVGNDSFNSRTMVMNWKLPAFLSITKKIVPCSIYVQKTNVLKKGDLIFSFKVEADFKMPSFSQCKPSFFAYLCNLLRAKSFSDHI